ncbi:MAG: DeoD-type purine-nucleoside phosphorylase [Bacilli bacterium]|nr:DeoD-type purine-nucleoside phosphorylase [Bacilli bacterium]
MATAHTNASKAQLAKVVLMPGDPVRANNIANQFLHDVEVVSDVRGIAIYTGYTANNKRISVMASGMGQPSIGIYAYEVYSLGVELIIRLGTAGSFNPDIHVKDVLIAESSHTRSNFAYQLDRKDVFDCDADKEAVEVAKECSKNLVDRHCIVGTIYTNDAFYGETKRMRDNWAKKGYIGVEMESFALYYTAKKLNKKALTLLTVSNHFINNEEDLTQKEKQVSMKNMMTLAIEVAERFAD